MRLIESRCYSVDWVGIYTTIAEVANFEKEIVVCLSLFLFFQEVVWELFAGSFDASVRV